MNASLYQPLFLAITATISFVTVFRNMSSSGYGYQTRRRSMLFPLLLSLIFIFWLGGRPASGVYFGDSANYAMSYAAAASGGAVHVDWHSEWVWGAIVLLCKFFDLDVQGFFTVVEAGYILSVLWAVKRFMPTNPGLGMMFVFTSLMFFTFGTNGLRNGLACHLMLLGMSFFFDNKYLAGALFCMLAFGTHRSTILPIAGMLAGRYLIKDMKFAILFWVGSIFVSLVAGDTVTNFFASLGFDDRMSAYNTTAYASGFSHTGFRWDFLLYSFFPILMGWYVCVKKRIKDDWYRTLCITYCLCNAFWVMVIRAGYSNRFAYLSWFMYPIVIAYPLINMPVWDDQDRKTAYILAAYCGFTVFMYAIYW